MKWSRKELDQILSAPFEIFPDRTSEMIKRGIPRGPLPWQRRVFLYLAPYKLKLADPMLHLHHTTYDAAFAGTGSGKCLGIDTPTLMYDGSIKPVQDVKVGDLLMGPDSKPRRVKSLARGREEMFKVTPVKGDSWVCNRSHILSLKTSGYRTRSYRINGSYAEDRSVGDVVNLSINDFLALSSRNQRCLKLWRSDCLEFTDHKNLDLDPYFLGVWLGDGHSSKAAVTTMDSEIRDCVYKTAHQFNLGIKIWHKGNKATTYAITSFIKGGNIRNTNPVLSILRQLGVLGNKHIPHKYLTASKNDRLKLLAGLIDTDGYVGTNCIEITQKNKTLSNDILFLARGLGFAAYQKEVIKSCKYKNKVKSGIYYKISISGSGLEEIPVALARKKCHRRGQSKDARVTGFTLESIGEGDYYGFEIEGPDRLFLLGDFTVTHNTSLGAALMMWWMTTFPGCYVIGGANKYTDFESNVIEKYIRPLLSIRNLWDHPWVTCIPNEHNKQLDLTIEVSPGVYKTSTAFFTHFADWERLKGKETSFIFFDEMSQLDDAEPFEELTRRLRSPLTPFKQFYGTTNPPTSMSHWIYDKWDFSQYIEGWEGEKPPPKLCTCQFCQECLNHNLGEFPYDENGYCTNVECANIETIKQINLGLATSQQLPLVPAQRVSAGLPKESYPDHDPYHCPGNQNMWRLFMGNSLDNYAIQASVMQNLKQSQDSATFNLHVLGKPSSLGANKAYYNFSLNNVVNDVPVDIEKDIHWSFDFNIIPQCSVICQLFMKTINGKEEVCPRVIDEIAKYKHWDGQKWKRGAGPEHVAQDFIKKYTEWNEKGGRKRWVLLHGDHTALNNRQSPSNPSDFQIIVNLLQDAGFNVLCTVRKIKGVQVLEKRRVNAVNWLLKDPYGNMRLEINRSCVHLRKSLEDMEIDKSTNSLRKKAIDDAVASNTNLDKVHLQSHISDALGYFIVRKWDLVGTDENPVSYVYVQGYKLIELSSDDVWANLNQPDKAPVGTYNITPEPGSLLEYIKELSDDNTNTFLGYFI